MLSTRELNQLEGHKNTQVNIQSPAIYALAPFEGYRFQESFTNNFLF